VVEKKLAGNNPFATPEYRSRFIRDFELRKQWEESRQKSLQKQADTRIKEIKELAKEAERILAQKAAERRARETKLVKESNTLPIGALDKLGRTHKMMASRYPYLRDKLFNAERAHQNKRKKPGWGRWGNLTKEQAVQNMQDWIDQTSGAVLPYTREEHWAQLLSDPEINNAETSQDES